jgi:hypothetical protein
MAALVREGGVNLRQQTGGGNVTLPRKPDLFERPPAVSSPRQHYNPFTAADEKIALSVVHVNNKPQYLVFCCHLRHPFTKQRELPVESAGHPCGTRISAVKYTLSIRRDGVSGRFKFHSQA